MELDLIKSLPNRIWTVNGCNKIFWQAIHYENLPFYCCICSRLGHDAGCCNKSLVLLAIASSSGVILMGPASFVSAPPHQKQKLTLLPKHNIPSTDEPTVVSVVPCAAF